MVEPKHPEAQVDLIGLDGNAFEKVSESDEGTLQVCVSVDACNLMPATKEQITAIINVEEKRKSKWVR